MVFMQPGCLNAKAGGQDCSCVNDLSQSVMNESRMYLLLVLREKSEEAFYYYFKFYLMSKSADIIYRALGRYAIERLILDSNTISIMCHFKPHIFAYLAGKRSHSSVSYEASTSPAVLA